MKVYTKDRTKELMLKHYPVSQSDRGAVYWYCKCGAFIDFERNYPDHIDDVLKRTKGD